MNCIILIEDATLGVQQQMDFATPGGVSPLGECMFMGQKYGLGIVLVQHGLSGLGPLIIRNTEAWLVTRFQGEDPRLIGNVLGISAEQVERMRVLRPGEFLCFNPVLWPKAVYATFPQPVIPGVCDEAVQETLVRQFFTAVTTRPPAPMETFRPWPAPAAPAPATVAGTPNSPAAKEPPAEQIQMLVIIASGIPKTAGKVYQEMGLSRTQCSKIANILETAGVIAAHRFSTGRIGGQLCFFEICPPGWAVLQSRGILPPDPLTKGGFAHQLAAQLLRAEAIRNALAIEFEVDFGGVRLDAVLLDKKTGSRTGYNLGISKPDHEIDSIEKFFALPAAQTVKFVLIARDVDFAKAVKKLLKARKAPDAIVKQVQIRLVAELVKE